VDMACVVWGGGGGCGSVAESKGHWWIYDGTRFRVYFHGLTGALMTLAFVIDLVIVFNAKEIRFNNDIKRTEKEEEEVVMEKGGDAAAAVVMEKDEHVELVAMETGK